MATRKKKRVTKKKKILVRKRSPWTLFTREQINRIVSFLEEKPFEILGPHFFKLERRVLINTFLPRAEEAWIRVSDQEDRTRKMKRIHSAGFFQAIFENVGDLFPYKVGFKDETGYSSETEDPYAFPIRVTSSSFGEPILVTEYDLYLIGEGTHFKSYKKFGAHLVTFNTRYSHLPTAGTEKVRQRDVRGVHFAVWAPNAENVSVIGNFNHWHPGAHPMTRIGAPGVWALFIPGLREGEVYKYAIRSYVDHEVRIKADPYAFQAELRPRTASVVSALDHYEWHDAEWLKKRAKQDVFTSPISIYEVHLGSWKRRGPKGMAFFNYQELARELVDYVKQMGYTHIELLPIMEHPLDQSWGYETLGYYAPTSRFGTPEDFMFFVDYCHQNDVGVILDWVPSHFPKDGHGLAYFDGKQIYAYEGWKKGEHKDWDTFVFDYGRNEVKNFLISNALFWLDQYHVDGLRVDAVASMLYLDYSRKEGEWEPNQYGGRENLEAISFLKKFNEVVHSIHPGILTIAEESTAWPSVSRPTYLGGLGFSMKWNMGWMHDMLEYFSKDSVYRKHHQEMLTFSMLYAFSENFILPMSHDEVVHGKRSLVGKMPGDDWQKFANLRLFLGLMFTHPGKKLLFMGDDFAQSREWDSNSSLDWHFIDYAPHKQIAQFVKDLNRLYRTFRAFYEVDFDHHGFEWIDFSDVTASLISFIRWSRDSKELILVTCNMTPVPRTSYRIGVPKAGFYEEILNSNAHEYGGTGMGNSGGIYAQDTPWQSRPHSVSIHFPPLAVNIYRWKAE